MCVCVVCVVCCVACVLHVCCVRCVVCCVVCCVCVLCVCVCCVCVLCVVLCVCVFCVCVCVCACMHTFLCTLHTSLLSSIIPFFSRQQIYNGLWPTTWDNLLAALIVFFLIMYIDHPKLNYFSHYLWLFGEYLCLDDSYPYILRILLISLVSSIVYFIVALYTRQYFLRGLLSYKGWLCKYIFLSTVFYNKCFLGFCA